MDNSNYFDDMTSLGSPTQSDFQAIQAAGQGAQSGQISPGQTSATAGLGLAGLGLSIYGTLQAQKEAKAVENDSLAVAGDEMNIQSLRQRQVNLMGQRQQLENYRNVQRTRAMGMAAGVSSGAQFGSGLAGAQGGESAQGAQSTRNLSQNLGLTNQIFSDTYAADRSQIQSTIDQSKMYQSQGWMSIGSAVLGSAATLGKLAP